MADSMRLVMTGVVELDKALQELASETGAKGINQHMRRACRDAVNEIVKPVVLQLIPWDTGYLESQIAVRAIKRSRIKVGYFIGFIDGSRPGQQTGTHYGWYIEFGWKHRLGVKVEADSFLRRALYPNAQRIVDFVRQRMREWIDQANQMAK